MLLVLTACTTNYYSTEQFITATVPAEEADTGDSVGTVPETDIFEDIEGAPDLNAYADDMAIEPFANDGVLYWLSVSDKSCWR